MMVPLSVILLAGGFGTRLRSLHRDLPKPMIPIGGEPFLEWVLRYWKRQGIDHAVLSLGHLAHVAQDHFARYPPEGLRIETVIESDPLGTGGAVRYAAQSAAGRLSNPFFVANGDSLVAAELEPALQLLEDGADGVLLGVSVPDASRYGTLVLDGGNRLLRFGEKQQGSGVINAGVYLFRRHLLDWFPPQTPLSMEVDVFPALLARAADLRVAICQAPFLDIGTPESLAQAESFLQANFA
jgi:D-glycero-alpha-D-manno-heptose 1-phosphate guanylyltransferase